jgi:uncharacterized protein (TIGR02145 family)
MKLLKENFRFVLFVLLSSLMPDTSIAQSIGKMPDNKVWTLKNLSLDIPGSYCYNDSAINCQKYGFLYTWEAAQKGCTSLGKGWHLPSTAEWTQLLKHYGGIFQDSISTGKEAFAKLLSKEKPTFGMTLAGNRNIDGTYGRIEGHGFYWTSTSLDENNAGYLNFANGRKVLFLQPDMEKIAAISVRCVKSSK